MSNSPVPSRTALPKILPVSNDTCIEVWPSRRDSRTESFSTETTRPVPATK